MEAGYIVNFRERDWVLLPGRNDNTYRLRPLTGVTDEAITVDKTISDIIGYSLPEERISPSHFPPPSPEDVSNVTSARLLWQSSRLMLRDGAAPLRSLGHISIRPRVYQFVPLLMALRLEPVRLFIADDVGVGKTIEALLVARELYDRGEINRLAVLCPPYLCDQWEKELREKFNLEAVVIRSSTIGALERTKPVNLSIYEYFPIQVISIDWVKSKRNRFLFLQFCPELVIVDEAHGAAEPYGQNKSQQRHSLLKEIAEDRNRHLMLLTATPHSGLEESFRSLLGLLKPEFAKWNIGQLTETQRKELAKHFVQRTRADILRDWEHEHCFPERVSEDLSYSLSKQYRELFEKTYIFCQEMVSSGKELEKRKRRVRFWGALALLRCVMSSPAAAVAALKNRAKGQGLEEIEEDPDFSSLIFETSETVTDDENPVPPIEGSEATLKESERKRLRRLSKLAQKLMYSKDDTKLSTATDVVRKMLKEGSYPVIWCRYVATAEYLGKSLKERLPKGTQVAVITGRLGDEERRAKIEEIDTGRPRVLVATDCLSEGVNLQEKFSAVLHFDLPWNPNRMEQREGRVDRYGQTEPRVKAIRFYGTDNPIDGAVLNVLLNKAREIHRALGTYVPVPEDSETVMEAVLNSLFMRKKTVKTAHGQRMVQKTLFEENPELNKLHKQWDLDVQRERINRTRFAQRAIKPSEVKRELEAVDKVLGDPEAVKEFMMEALDRLGLTLKRDEKRPKVYRLFLSESILKTLPEAVSTKLFPIKREKELAFSFDSPTPAGASYIGRNHPLVTALARYLFENALSAGENALVPRCGVIRTRAVSTLTALLLLRVRYLLRIPQRPDLLAEEVMAAGFRLDSPPDKNWLSEKDALFLLENALPSSNISLPEKRELLEWILEEMGEWQNRPDMDSIKNPFQKELSKRLKERAKMLTESHKRIRKAVRLRIRELKVLPQFPPDLLGLLVLQPEVTP